MRTMRALWIIVLLSIVFTGVLFSVQAQDEEATEDNLVELVALSPEFADWLANYPDWIGQGWQSDGDYWYIEFYSADWEEWLGYATVNVVTKEFADYLVPSPLPPEEFQEGQARVTELVLHDPEVLARLVEPLLWDVYVDFNRWDRVWEVTYYRGVNAVRVICTYHPEEDYFSIDSIGDPNVFDEETAFEDARSEAISLAYTADGVDAALEGYDDWTTYSEHLGDGIWTVEFAAGDQELFFAQVDIENDVVLEAGASR